MTEGAGPAAAPSRDLPAHAEVTIRAGHEETLRLGELLGSGGAGVVYELPDWGNDQWVIKVLDPDSPVAKQEIGSLGLYRGNMRYAVGLMKFSSWQGELTFGGRTYPCYFMRRGKTLKEAVDKKDPRLKDPETLLRLIACLVQGLCALRDNGLSHGDIKPGNILLAEYKGRIFPMLADYGTVAKRKHGVRTVGYTCQKTEYKTLLEERIAYDLQCLYLAIRPVCGADGDVLSAVSPGVAKLLRIMRDPAKKGFARLDELKGKLEDWSCIPVSFYLDAVPDYELTEELPFEEVMGWKGFRILRDRNAPPGEPFDPLLLMEIPQGRYRTACELLRRCNDIGKFVMPICRYVDKEGGEHVLVHAPDDREKCLSLPRSRTPAAQRIRGPEGVPFTLESAPAGDKERVLAGFAKIPALRRADVAFSEKDIWHMDGNWKLNLFSVDRLEMPEKIRKNGKTPSDT